MPAVYLEHRAEKELKKLDLPIRDRILEAIDALQHDTFPAGSTKLKGNPMGRSDNDFWRIRVGDYRIIYTTEEGDLVVVVVRVRHRKDAYR